MTISNIMRKVSPYLFIATMFLFFTTKNEQVSFHWIWLLVAIFLGDIFFSGLGAKYENNKLKNRQRFEKYNEKR